MSEGGKDLKSEDFTSGPCYAAQVLVSMAKCMSLSVSGGGCAEELLSSSNKTVLKAECVTAEDDDDTGSGHWALC